MGCKEVWFGDDAVPSGDASGGEEAEAFSFNLALDDLRGFHNCCAMNHHSILLRENEERKCAGSKGNNGYNGMRNNG